MQAISLHKEEDNRSQSRDIREEIFRDRLERSVTAVVIAEAEGVLSGLERCRLIAEDLGLVFETEVRDGSTPAAGAVVATVAGNPVQISKAEELLLGELSKSSGIATAARKAKAIVSSRCRVVCGGSKKMPHEIKGLVRKAVVDGGLDVRMLDQPFLYLDKNYVRIFGGVQRTLEAVAPLGRPTVIQVRGELGPIEEEALAAAVGGAGVIMVDTGRRGDLETVLEILHDNGLRSSVEVAFSGNIELNDLEDVSRAGADILDVGYAILDAPCLPMRFDVVI